MKLQRRTFLKLFSLASLSLASQKGHATVIGMPSRFSLNVETINNYLDTLIPADETPSASQLGVTDQLLQQAHKNRSYANMLKQGCDWLDQQAQRHKLQNFNLASELLRVSIVSLAEKSASHSLAYRFYATTRHQAFFHYYAHPNSQLCLNGAGPPQPLGYIDYDKPPKHTSEQCQ